MKNILILLYVLCFSVTSTLAAYSPGTVVSNGAKIRHEFVRFGGATQRSNCTSSPCTINVQSGTWLSSVSRTAAGSYTLNIVSGMFSAAPVCVCISKPIGVTGGWCMMDDAAASTTAYQLLSTNTGGTATDANVEVHCSGPR